MRWDVPAIGMFVMFRRLDLPPPGSMDRENSILFRRESLRLRLCNQWMRGSRVAAWRVAAISNKHSILTSGLEIKRLGQVVRRILRHRTVAAVSPLGIRCPRERYGLLAIVGAFICVQ